MDENDVRRFWKYVEVKGSDDCWLWTGKSIVKGDGVKAHAIAAEHNVSVQTVWGVVSGRTWKHTRP